MSKLTLFLLSFGLTLFSCSERKTDKKSGGVNPAITTANTMTHKGTSNKNKIDAKIYFEANGTEPFWSLTISEEMIKLNISGDSIMIPHSDPIHAQDSNVKLYKLHTERAEMNIQISHSECVNAMSGIAFPYSVTVDFKPGRETKFTSMKGCGAYITDYRLHDIWVLENLNDRQVDETEFDKNLPSIEINTKPNTFSGYTGCNRLNGKLFYERGVLRFMNSATTMKMCGPNNREREFLNALNAVTDYKIENNRLWLFNPSKQLLVFKKID